MRLHLGVGVSYTQGMAEVTVRDLRNHSGRVLDRVEAGESVTITRNGKSVARLSPVPRRPMSASALVERFSHLSGLDAQQLRNHIDQIVDQKL